MKRAGPELDFSTRRQELLALMLKKKGISVTPAHVIRRRAVDAPAPLSFAQQRLWFLDQLEPGNTSYNMPLVTRMRGRLDVAALAHSLEEIVRRHEILRTTFTMLDDQPVQVVAPAARAPRLALTDLSAMPEGEREGEAMRLIAEEVRRPFHLRHEMPLRVGLLRLLEDEHIILLTLHHIASDGWSMNVLMREVETLYGAFAAGQSSPLTELPIQYSDYATWQREYWQGEALELQLAYWKTGLADAPALLELPTDRPRPLMQSFRGGHESFALTEALTDELRELCRGEEVTLFMLLLGAFQVLLMRYTGQERVSVGSPMSGRDRLETEKLIGLFAHTLVLHTDLRDNPCFTNLLKRVRETVLGAFAHQDVPFEKLVEELQPERSLSHAPLFQAMFILQNAAPQATALPGLQLESVSAEDGTAKFDLTLSMAESGRGLRGTWEYNADLFDAKTVRRMIGHLEQLLESITQEPRQFIWRLPLLTDSERGQLERWSGVYADEDEEQREERALPLHQLFEAQVSRTPDHPAVLYQDDHLSYRELDTRANQLAQLLRQSGVGPETLVGILLPRSMEMVLALLAVHKSGGAYLPLDPQYPPERLSLMLEDSAASVVVTVEDYRESLAQHAAQVICIDADRGLIEQQPTQAPCVEVLADNLAYVIYTSGSTGIPKGVALSHRNAASLIHWASLTFSAQELSLVLASTSICFDLSIFELFVPLSLGGSLLLADSALSWPSLAAAQQVTLINTVPSAMTALLREELVPDSVLTINLAGEALTQELSHAVYERTKAERLYNLYGPTEDTTYSTCALVKRGEKGVPGIGKAIGGKRVYVLDREQEIVPLGVVGELYMGGGGIARGYLRREGVTAERFMPERLMPEREGAGGRMYRTGDLVRWREDGELEYLGRMDHQVKIRGFRIELGEIEATLNQHPLIRESVVIAREEGDIAEKRLVAYIVPKVEGATATTSELRSYLMKSLPEYMMPASFVLLREMPLTPNGKINRRVLPAPDAARPELEREYLAPRTELEHEVATVWQEVLRVERVGVHDNFFELGGHSLLATKVVSRLHLNHGIELPLRSLFETPTVAGLTAILVESLAARADAAAPELIQRVEREEGEETLSRLDKLSDEEVEALFPDLMAELKKTDEQR